MGFYTHALKRSQLNFNTYKKTLEIVIALRYTINMKEQTMEKRIKTYSGRTIVLRFENIDESKHELMSGIVLGCIRCGFNLDESIQVSLEHLSILKDETKSLSGHYLEPR